MGTLVLNPGQISRGHDHLDEHKLIIPDLETLLAHPEVNGESLATIKNMASEIEAYLRQVLVEPSLRRAGNPIGAFLRHRFFGGNKAAACACGSVQLHRGVCRTCFERELEVLRRMRPEMEAGIEAAKHIGNSSRQEEAHLSAYNAKVLAALRLAAEQALKVRIFEVLGVNVQIWGSDISDEGFRRETLKVTQVAVPSEGLRFLALLMANNDKLPRRSAPPWVYVKGLDPYLVPQFDIGIFCGVNAIQVAVHKWE